MFSKKILVIVVILSSLIAYASVTLVSTTVLTTGGVTVETNDTVIASYMEVNWQANQLRLFYKYGSGGNTFTGGTAVADLIVTLNLTNGAWTTNKNTTGNLTAPQLTSIQNTVKGWRNSAENFAVNQGILSGTQNAW